jgi:hypothetical protein
MIVEYKLHRNSDGNKCIPSFIEDGGYYVSGNKLVGITVNDDSYVPSTLVELDKAALVTKYTAMSPVSEDTGDALTSAEIESEIDTFIAKDS